MGISLANGRRRAKNLLAVTCTQRVTLAACVRTSKSRPLASGFRVKKKPISIAYDISQSGTTGNESHKQGREIQMITSD